MAIHFDYAQEPTHIFGLSTDTKMLNVDVGTLFYETDTYDWYIYTKNGWSIYYK